MVLSLLGAMLGYVIIAAETPFEAARQGVFPKSFARTNKNERPSVSSRPASRSCSLIVSVFLLVHVPILLRVRRVHHPHPHVLGDLLHEDGSTRAPDAEQVKKARVFGTVGFVCHGVPRVGGRAGGNHDHHYPVRSRHHRICHGPARTRREDALPNMADKAIAAVIVVLMAVSIASWPPGRYRCCSSPLRRLLARAGGAYGAPRVGAVRWVTAP